MNLRYELRRRLRYALAPALGACAVAYFGYHAIQGDHGLITYLRYSQYIETLRQELSRVSAEHDKLEHRVTMMRANSLDPDLLEERARDVLGFIHPDERVIYLDQAEPVAPGQD